jgi:hypothetical protein
MTAKSNYLEDKITDHVLRGTAAPFTAPVSAALAACLCSADPTEAGTGASISEPPDANGYDRKNPTFSASSGGVSSNTNVLTFGPASNSNWPTITHIAICDSLTYGAGNMLYHGVITNKTVEIGDSYVIAIGDLDIGEL